MNNKKFYAWGSVKKWLKDRDVPIVYDQYISSARCWRLGEGFVFQLCKHHKQIERGTLPKEVEKYVPRLQSAWY